MKKIITLSCILFYALTTHAQNAGDYRSIKSGNWTDYINVWQKYNGSKWTTATAYPTNSAGIISIQDTTNVTINTTLTIDQCLVNAGGQLTLNNNYTVTLANTTGDDLIVNGDLDMSSGTIASPGSIKINGLFSWRGGSLQAAITNEGLISIPYNVNLYSVLTNNSTVNWMGQYLEFQGGTINNNGIFNALSENYLYNDNGGAFNNNSNGIFNQSGIAGTTSGVTYNNKGTMNFNAGIFLVDQNSTFTNTKTLNFNDGSFGNNAISNFNAGTKITGRGNIVQSYNTLNVNLALTVPADVIFTLNDGTVAGSGSLKLSGLMAWNHGSINVALTLLGSSVMNIGSNEAVVYSTITNNGKINWDSQYITFEGGTIINNKIFNAYGNGYLYNGNGGTFTNSATGIFTIDVGTGNISNRIAFNNAGTININSGEFYNENSGTFTNTGTLNLSNTAFENTATANFNAGTTFTGKGQIINSDNTMNVNTSVTVPSTIGFYLINSSSSTLVGTGSLKINGSMFWQNGYINVPVVIQNTGIINISGTSGLQSTLTNNGVINWTTNDIYFYGGSIINNKTFNISGNYSLDKSSSGSLTNSAMGIITQSSLGVTTATIAVTNKGTIKGTGTFDFGTNLTNTGTFAPGIGAATGILTTGGDYKNKALYIKMDSTLPGIGYDRLLVEGNVTLGNDTLNITTSGSMPTGSYIVLKWSGKRTGTFKVTHLPAGYSITYQANKVLVNVPAGFAATEPAQQSNANVIKSNTNINTLAVYPNPASQAININYQPKNKDAMLQIFDVDGKPVLQKSITPGISNTININRLAAGAYLAQVNDGEITRSAKFVKQ